MEQKETEDKDNGQNGLDELDGTRPFTPGDLLDSSALDEVMGITGSDSTGQQAKLGVLQRIITAVIDDKHYRQILLTAAFDDKHEAMLAADAIAERQRYGVPITPIVDRILAQCAVGSNRVERVLTALTHYTLNTNLPGAKQPFWKRKQEDKSLT